jgi:hypothetical protein
LQTFLPEASFVESARALDDQRLGKQRVECLQILTAITTGKGWIHHPATLMWQYHVDALREYSFAVVDEWKHRGFADTVWSKIAAMVPAQMTYEEPPWIGDEVFHASHRSNLIRKKPEHYKKLWHDGHRIPDDLEYAWPVMNSGDSTKYVLKLSRAGAKKVAKGERRDPMVWAGSM